MIVLKPMDDDQDHFKDVYYMHQKELLKEPLSNSSDVPFENPHYQPTHSFKSLFQKIKIIGGSRVCFISSVFVTVIFFVSSIIDFILMLSGYAIMINGSK